MAAVQPTSNQHQTGSSRSQTTSTCIPLQTRAAPSTLQTPTSQSITPQSHTQPAPVPRPPTSSRIWDKPLTGNIIACVALVVALIFGIGAWIGQAYGNAYARKSYEITLWGLCLDHPDIQENEACHESLRDGLHRSVKRDLGVEMQLGALSQVEKELHRSVKRDLGVELELGASSQVEKFYSDLVFWSICLLATTIWNVLLTILTPFIRPIYFDKSYNATQQRWKQGLVNSACIAVATTKMASIAHILWSCYISRTSLLGAVSLGVYSHPCLITCLGLIWVWDFLKVSYRHMMKPASKRSAYRLQIMLRVVSASPWFYIHKSLTETTNNHIEALHLLEFLYFSLCLAGFALPVNTFDGSGTLSWVPKWSV